MSALEDILKKRKKLEEEKATGKKQKTALEDVLERREQIRTTGKLDLPESGPISPIKTTTKKKEEDDKKWYQKIFTKGEFEDGFDLMDIPKTITGTATDISQELSKGFVSPFESLIDVGANTIASGANALGLKNAEKSIRDFADRDLSGQLSKNITNAQPVGIIHNILNGTPENILNPTGAEWDKDKNLVENLTTAAKNNIAGTNKPDTSYEKSSVFGEYADKTSELVGYSLSLLLTGGALTKATGTVAKGLTTKAGTTALGASASGGNIGLTVAGTTLNIPTLAVVGGMAGGLEEANSKEGVTELERWSKALSSGAWEGISEGIGGVFGVGGITNEAGEELFDVLGAKAASKFKSSAAKMLVSLGIKPTPEAGEELLSYTLNYLTDNHLIDKLGDADFSKEWDWAEVGEQMALAFVSAGITQGGGQVIQTNSAIKAAEEQLGRKLTSEEKALVTQASIEGTLENKVAELEQRVSGQNNNQNVQPQTTQTVEQLENEIIELESQLNENLSDEQYNAITDQIRIRENQIEQLEQNGPTTTQEVETNSLVDASSNTLNNVNTQVQSRMSPVANEQQTNSDVEIPSDLLNVGEESLNISEAFKEEISEKTKAAQVNKTDVQMIPVQKIKHLMNSGGHRTSQQIDNLVRSIKKEGITEAIKISKGTDGKAVIHDGNHRLAIATKMGLNEVPVKFIENAKMSDIENNTQILYNTENKADLDYISEDYSNGVRNVEKTIENNDRNRNKRTYSSSNSVEIEDGTTTTRNDGLSDKVEGHNNRSSSDTIYDRNTGRTKQELDNSSFFNEKSESISPVKETTSNVQKDLTPLKQATKELKQVQKEVKAQVKELKEQISEFKALTKEQYQEYDKMYQESLEQLKEMKAPVRNNLTEEESERADNLEVMDKAFGLDSQEIEEYNELQDIERGMNYDAVDNQYYEDYYEEQFFEDGVETPNVPSRGEVIYDIKTKLDIKPNEAKEIYNKIANDTAFTLEDTRNLVEEKIEKANTIEYENEEIRDIRKYIRSTKLDMSFLKQQFPSSKDYNAFRKANFGKLKLGNSGTSIDVFYQELLEDYEGYFNSRLTNEMDQLKEIVHFMDNNPIYETMEGEPIPDEYIDSVANEIYNGVLDSEAARQIDEDFNSYVKEIEAEIKEGVQPKLSPVQEETREIPKDPTKESSYEDDTPKSRKQLQRRLDTVNKQIERITNLEDQMKEKLQKYDDRINKVKEQIEEDIIKNGPLSPLDQHINDNVIQGIVDSSTKYVEKYDRYHTKLQELTNERVQLEEQIENTPEKKTRKDIQRELVEKTGIIEIGLDNANRMSKFMLNNTDPIRIQEMIFGQEVGNKINDEFFQKVKNNTSEKTRWLNKQRNEIKDLGIKARSKESAAVQKYGEKQWIDEKGEKFVYGDTELANEFPNVETQRRIKNAAQEIRQLYDNYLETVNPILTEMGYNPIPKRADYFRHFQELNDKFSQFGIPLNLNDMKANDLPTDINGITADFNPGKNFFASTLERLGEKTTYDAITGIDGYLEGVANLIYHTEDVQRLRGFEQYIRETYGQQHGYEGLEALQPEQRIKRMKAIQDNRLSNYASWLHEYTNQLAGKKAMVDRSFEDLFGRRMYSILDTANKQVGANMIGFNLSSAGTNLIAGVNALAKTDKIASAKGLYDTVVNIFHKDGFVEKNGFLTSRFGSDRLSKTPWEKMQDAGFIFMSGVDNFTSNFVVRSKFNELKAKGYSDSEAHIEAGKFASKILADRSQGAQPTLYNSKVLGLLTKFQYEVNNQVYSMFYDTLQESKAKSNNNAVKTSASMLFTLGQLAVFTHMFGAAFKEMAGYNPTFDILEIISKAFGYDDDEDSEDTLTDNLGQAFKELLKDLPYISTFLDGGRIPVSEAFKGPLDIVKAATGGKDEYGQEVTWSDAGKSVLGTIPYWFLPTGYGQTKKTIGGLEMFDGDLPVAGSYTDSGNLRFDIEPTKENIIKSAIFGKWANKEAQEYIDSGFKTINKSKIDEFKAMGMKSSEYKKLKSAISQSGKTNEDKVNYITSREDLSDYQKNLLINNILDRDYDVDVSDYDNFSSYEEFDYSYRYPEKYQWLKANGISYSKFSSSDETKEIYNYAYNNPEKFDLGVAATNDFEDYYYYKQDINDLKADKKSDGKTISGSRKKKVINYVNSLDLSIPQKAMIIRTEYSSFDEYNYDIVDYVGSLNITYEKKVKILEELDMKVYEDGTVEWE